MRVPSPPTLFLGRDAELERLRSMLGRVRSALIFGVAGVGKSTLAYALAARWPHPVIYHRVEEDEPAGVVVDRALHQLARDAVPASTPEAERVAELAERLDAASALLLIDDAHRLAPGGHALFFHQLAGQLRTGRLVATSRELNALGPDAPDRLELRLDGLDEPGARLLWTSLDELYGPSSGFELAWARSRGNPFLLRRGHAGDLSEEDPIARSVAQLSPPERRLAGALALASVPLPTAALLKLLPAPDGRPVLRRLVTRMVVSVDGAGGCSLHDLFREAVTAALGEAERRELHEALASLLREAELEPVARVAELCRHLRALGRHEEAGSVLAETSAQWVRDGATAELLRALEAVPPERRTHEVRILRARTLARLLEVRRAFEELRGLVEDGVSPRFELKLAFGHLAMLTARLEVAGAALEEVLSAPEAPLALRLRAGLGLALTRTYLGRGDEARAHLEAAMSAVPGRLERGFLLFSTAFSLWLEGRAPEAEEPMRTALGLFQEAPATFRGAVLAPAFSMVLLANLGHLEEAGQMQATAEAAVKRGEDVRMRMYLRASKAVLHFERGERLRALAELRAVLDALARGGEVLWALWTRAWIGAWLVELGRVREGLEALADAEQGMRGAGMETGLRFIERARSADLVSQLQAGALPVPGRATSLRARALAALEAGRQGDLRRLRALLEEAPPPATPDFALERALGHLALAVASRLEGRGEESSRELAEAGRVAAEGRVDPELVPALFDRLAPVRIVTSASRLAARASPAPEDLSRYEALLDARNHVLKLGGRQVSLRRRPVLRRLLYALASRPGTVLTKEALSVAIWSAGYDPLRHDNALRVNVRYLRELLAGSPLSVEFDDTGYRLLVPEGFAYIDAPGQDF